jgi:hypothetical protein
LVLGWVPALAQELSKPALLVPLQQLVAVPSSVRKPHGPKPTLRLLLALHRLGLHRFDHQHLEELKDLAQDSAEQHLEAVVVQPAGESGVEGVSPGEEASRSNQLKTISPLLWIEHRGSDATHH